MGVLSTRYRLESPKGLIQIRKGFNKETEKATK